MNDNDNRIMYGLKFNKQFHSINRWFGGLINDVKRKLPHYHSDFTDALSIQSIASIVFLYFACLTPIITFGGLLGDATGNNIVSFVFFSQIRFRFQVELLFCFLLSR